MKFALLETKCCALAHLWLLSIAKLHAPEVPKSSFLKSIAALKRLMKPSSGWNSSLKNAPFLPKNGQPH